MFEPANEIKIKKDKETKPYKPTEKEIFIKGSVHKQPRKR
jgi:hypothetical protein